MGCILAAACAILVGTGCSGINASKGVSPATFLLPGLLQADPPPATNSLAELPPTLGEPIQVARR
jgi:hypothetical protein